MLTLWKNTKICRAVDICPDDLCAPKMGWQWTPCPLYSSPPPTLLGLFLFLIMLTFVFSISISCLNQTWRTCSPCCSKGSVRTCLYRDVHRCDTNQWFDTKVTLLNPVISIETLSSSASLLSLSVGLFSRVELLVFFVPTLPADGTWQNNVSWRGSTMADNLYLSQKWHHCLG